MLSKLYQEQVQLTLSIHTHCVTAMRLWENAAGRGLVARSVSYTRSKAIMSRLFPSQLNKHTVESWSSDLDYVMESALEAIGEYFDLS